MRGWMARLCEAKMLILGEGGAGKTSLLRRLYQPDQPLPSSRRALKATQYTGTNLRSRMGVPFG